MKICVKFAVLFGNGCRHVSTYFIFNSTAGSDPLLIFQPFELVRDMAVEGGVRNTSVSKNFGF